MSEANLSDLFLNECSDKYGIRPTHALQAVDEPDQTSVLQQDGLELRIHSKYVSNARPPFYLVVTEQVHEGKSAIQFALKAYPDLHQDFGNLPPNDMLETIADRFGLPIQVGAKVGKFIWAAKIPINGPGDISILRSHAPTGHSFVQQMVLRIDKGPPMNADVAMAYALDTTAYVAWLNAHKK